MKGIEPPSPNVIGPFPKYAFDAVSIDFSSHGAVTGASHPVPPFSGSNVTRAPYGGSLSKSAFNLLSRPRALRVGGRRSDNFNEVFGRSTLPPCTRSGRR